MLTWIRDNPQFAALSFAALVLTIVMTVLAIVMHRAGASLRPIVWFVGFFAIVAGPQAVVHLLDGFVLRTERIRQENVTDAPPEVARASSGLAPVDWSKIFGLEADPALITDAKLGLGVVLSEAIEAKLSFRADGASALAARFEYPEAAERALERYGSFFAFVGAEGSDKAGWTARRHSGQGEWVHVVTAGPELYAWTNANKSEALANRVRALGPIPNDPQTAVSASSDESPKLVSKRLSSNVGVMLSIVSLNLVAAGLWFFKGSAWAARVERSVAAKPQSVLELQQKLLGTNPAGVPTEVTMRPDGAVEINWKYADARWFDLMRVHQMKRTQRLILFLDEASHTVRVREYWSAFDASSDFKYANFDWKTASGIQFFAVEHRRVVGVQLDKAGKPTGELSKAYTFDLQALKAPIIDVVTRGGWRWQPLAWDAPVAMRWLTE